MEGISWGVGKPLDNSTKSPIRCVVLMYFSDSYAFNFQIPRARIALVLHLFVYQHFLLFRALHFYPFFILFVTFSHTVFNYNINILCLRD